MPSLTIQTPESNVKSKAQRRRERKRRASDKRAAFARLDRIETDAKYHREHRRLAESAAPFKTRIQPQQVDNTHQQTTHSPAPAPAPAPPPASAPVIVSFVSSGTRTFAQNAAIAKQMLEDRCNNTISTAPE